jgi:hypothetical protein
MQIVFGAFFSVLRDWIATSGGQNSIQAAPDISRALDEGIKELATAGFVVGEKTVSPADRCSVVTCSMIDRSSTGR